MMDSERLAERARVRELPQGLLELAAAAGDAAALAALGRRAGKPPRTLAAWYETLVPGDQLGALDALDVLYSIQNAAGLAVLELVAERAGELLPGDADMAKVLRRATRAARRSVLGSTTAVFSGRK